MSYKRDDDDESNIFKKEEEYVAVKVGPNGEFETIGDVSPLLLLPSPPPPNTAPAMSLNPKDNKRKSNYLFSMYEKKPPYDDIVICIINFLKKQVIQNQNFQN